MKKNPWLEINISDYVNHMSRPEVEQYGMINESFNYALQKYKPQNIFVPGCTIGNGFEYIEWDRVNKVTALDINPEFLKILGSRFPGENKLEIINKDFQDFETDNKQYNLIFSALFFEYVALDKALAKFKLMMDRNSVLFSIIQLPVENQSKVSDTEYKSLEKLIPFINLISGDEFEREINKSGLIIRFSEQKVLKNGKSFLITESFISDGERNEHIGTQ
ncbi:MAG TPA: class I SAM-dependent methyltransferase [Ignavibacteriaceae bacterium]